MHPPLHRSRHLPYAVPIAIFLGLAIVSARPGTAAPGPFRAGAGPIRHPTAAESDARLRGARLARPSAATPAAHQLLIVEDEGRIAVGRDGAVRTGDGALAARLAVLGLDRGRELWHGGGLRFVRLESSGPGFDPAAAAASLTAAGLVRAAAPNVGLRLCPTMPNDPDLASQWYVYDYGGPADIKLPDAWDTERGSATVRIGIVDTGVDLGHPDLASKIWVNPGEIPGNGVDDDGDGYIDDVHGWDFGNDDNDPNPHAVIDSSLGLDVGFHGTFVAGIAAAATDNAEGIAGAGWNCTLVPLKVADSTGVINAEYITKAVGYAADHHFEVLNFSLGTPGDSTVAQYFQLLMDQAAAAGVLCVAAAGNDSTSAPSYPAACRGVLSVGATDDSDARAPFSNWGSWVRIAAPGASMWSAICRNYVVDDLSQLFYYLFFGWDGARPYMYGDGTSFSSPLAAGVCALVRSRHPAWSAAQVRDQVIATGDTVAYDLPIGPKLNAARAVTAAPAAVRSAPTGARFAASPNPFVHASALSFWLPVPCPGGVRVVDCAGRVVRELDPGPLAAGPHVVRWDGTDQSGGEVRAGIYFAELGAGGQRIKLVRLR
jgi:subtilisin family serine protease